VKRQFLPVFEEDNQIKDALSYFCCVKDIDELRKEWKESREKMVEVGLFLKFSCSVKKRNIKVNKFPL
jgi:hypothetical protein